MDRFVARKLEEKAKQDGVKWSDDEAAKYMAELLV